MRKVPKLRFKEFSDEWEERKLGEVAELIDGDRGKNYPNENDILESGILFLSTSNFYNNKLIFNQQNKYISQEKFNLLSKGKVTNQDLIITLRGSIGNIVVFENNKFDTAFINAQMMIIRPYFNNKYFLYYLIQTLKNQKEIENISSGSAQPQLTKKDLKSFKLYFPFLQEQEKIANFLSSIDKKISLTEEKLELFREYKKGVMQKIFSQELRFKDSNGNDYPEWEEKRLEEVTECLDNLRKPLNSNEREKIKGNIPYYGANGIQGYINNYIFNEELVLLAEDGGNFDDYLTKPIAQYVQGKSWINNHAHVLKGKKVLKTKFLYFSLVHKDIRSFINGTSRSKLNKSNMLNIIILLPTVEEQHKIADFLSSIDSKIESIEKELERLKEFKKGLLQQMFV